MSTTEKKIEKDKNKFSEIPPVVEGIKIRIETFPLKDRGLPEEQLREKTWNLCVRWANKIATQFEIKDEKIIREMAIAFFHQGYPTANKKIRKALREGKNWDAHLSRYAKEWIKTDENIREALSKGEKWDKYLSGHQKRVMEPVMKTIPTKVEPEVPLIKEITEALKGTGTKVEIEKKVEKPKAPEKPEVTAPKEIPKPPEKEISESEALGVKTGISKAAAALESAYNAYNEGKGNLEEMKNRHKELADAIETFNNRFSPSQKKYLTENEIRGILELDKRVRKIIGGEPISFELHESLYQQELKEIKIDETEMKTNLDKIENKEFKGELLNIIKNYNDGVEEINKQTTVNYEYLEKADQIFAMRDAISSLTNALLISQQPPERLTRDAAEKKISALTEVRNGLEKMKNDPNLTEEQRKLVENVLPRVNGAILLTSIWLNAAKAKEDKNIKNLENAERDLRKIINSPGEYGINKESEYYKKLEEAHKDIVRSIEAKEKDLNFIDRWGEYIDYVLQSEYPVKAYITSKVITREVKGERKTYGEGSGEIVLGASHLPGGLNIIKFSIPTSYDREKGAISYFSLLHTKDIKNVNGISRFEVQTRGGELGVEKLTHFSTNLSLYANPKDKTDIGFKYDKPYSEEIPTYVGWYKNVNPFATTKIDAMVRPPAEGKKLEEDVIFVREQRTTKEEDIKARNNEMMEVIMNKNWGAVKNMIEKYKEDYNALLALQGYLKGADSLNGYFFTAEEEKAIYNLLYKSNLNAYIEDLRYKREEIGEITPFDVIYEGDTARLEIEAMSKIRDELQKGSGNINWMRIGEIVNGLNTPETADALKRVSKQLKEIHRRNDYGLTQEELNRLDNIINGTLDPVAQYTWKNIDSFFKFENGVVVGVKDVKGLNDYINSLEKMGEQEQLRAARERLIYLNSVLKSSEIDKIITDITVDTAAMVNPYEQQLLAQITIKRLDGACRIAENALKLPEDKKMEELGKAKKEFDSAMVYLLEEDVGLKEVARWIDKNGGRVELIEGGLANKYLRNLNEIIAEKERKFGPLLDTGITVPSEYDKYRLYMRAKQDAEGKRFDVIEFKNLSTERRWLLRQLKAFQKDLSGGDKEKLLDLIAAGNDQQVRFFVHEFEKQYLDALASWEKTKLEKDYKIAITGLQALLHSDYVNKELSTLGGGVIGRVKLPSSFRNNPYWAKGRWEMNALFGTETDETRAYVFIYEADSPMETIVEKLVAKHQASPEGIKNYMEAVMGVRGEGKSGRLTIRSASGMGTDMSYVGFTGNWGAISGYASYYWVPGRVEETAGVSGRWDWTTKISDITLKPWISGRIDYRRVEEGEKVGEVTTYSTQIGTKYFTPVEGKPFYRGQTYGEFNSNIGFKKFYTEYITRNQLKLAAELERYAVGWDNYKVEGTISGLTTGRGIGVTWREEPTKETLSTRVNLSRYFSVELGRTSYKTEVRDVGWFMLRLLSKRW